MCILKTYLWLLQVHLQDIPKDPPGSDWRADQAQGPEAEGAWGGGDVVFREGQAGGGADPLAKASAIALHGVHDAALEQVGVDRQGRLVTA